MIATFDVINEIANGRIMRYEFRPLDDSDMRSRFRDQVAGHVILVDETEEDVLSTCEVWLITFNDGNPKFERIC